MWFEWNYLASRVFFLVEVRCEELTVLVEVSQDSEGQGFPKEEKKKKKEKEKKKKKKKKITFLRPMCREHIPIGNC